MADLFWVKGTQFFDDSGNPLNGGKLYTYDAGTLNLRSVYQDSGAVTPWSNPIVLSAGGKLTASVYIQTGTWKYVLKTSAGVTVPDTGDDNIPGAVAANATDFANPETRIVTKAANFTVAVADIGTLFVVDTTGGTVTASLPAANLVANGRGVGFLHNGTANFLTMDGNGAETISGSATLTLRKKGMWAWLVSDGASAWHAKTLPTILRSLANLGTAADKFFYTDGVDSIVEGDITAAGRALLDDAAASNQRTTLGLGTIATQAASAVAITGGSVTGITDVTVADGGTNASTAAGARTNLGVGTIGTLEWSNLVSTATTSAVNTYPVGHHVMVDWTGAEVNRNSSATISYSTAAARFENSASNTLTGTWRANGFHDVAGNTWALFQRRA